MKTCLKLYHHSLFSEHAHPHVHPDIGRDGDADADVDAGADEESTAKKQAGKGEVVEKGSRRLNVELTCVCLLPPKILHLLPISGAFQDH